MSFNIAKCKVIHLRIQNVGHTYMMGDCILGCNDSERDLGIMVDNQLNMNSWCDTVTKKTNEVLGYISRGNID